jgi:hypothetical protein
MAQPTTRRHVVRLLAGAALLAASGERVLAARKTARKAALIGRLIAEARALPRVSQRIDFISHALLGVRYQAHTLIGGPKHPERFVVRDDAFDCVTFCEVVLAAAIARDLDAFETSLRRIRYDHGKVQWDQRNHYFAEWSRRNIENRICQPVVMQPSVTIEKNVSWHRALGKRHVSIVAVPRATLLQSAKSLSPGDIIGFISRRSNLDFFHTGLVAFSGKGALLLRHASRSRGRVIEESMAAFVTANPVKYVALLRALEPEAPITAERKT